MQLSGSYVAGIAGFLTLISHVLAEQLFDESSENSVEVQSEPRCLCNINLDDNEAAYELGEVRRFTDLSSDPKLDKALCRKLRHQCRHECARMSDLAMREASGAQLGFSLCAHHRQVTTSAGIGFSSYATLEGCPQHIPIAPVLSEQRLCCGHTGISMKPEYSHDHKTYIVFGWNPDCQAETFIVH